MSTYNPKDPGILKVIILDKNPILNEDETIREILSNYQFIKSRSQSYHLKRLLIRAKFTSNESRSVTKFIRPNCGLNMHLKEGNSITFKCGNFKIYENMSCEVKNVIYVINCRCCGEEYIRESSNFAGLIRIYTVCRNFFKNLVIQCDETYQTPLN